MLDRVRELGWTGVVGNTDEMLWDRSARAEQERKAPRLAAWLHQLFETLAPWAHERLGEERIEWLRHLPREWRLQRLLVLHASPHDLWRAPLPEASDADLRTVFGGQDADLVVYGHIHRPYVRDLAGGLSVANSGSVGLPYDGDWRASYLLIENGRAAVRRVAYDLERELWDIRSAGFPLGEWLAQSQRHGQFVRPSQA